MFTTSIKQIGATIIKITEFNKKALIFGLDDDEWDSIKDNARDCAEQCTEMSMIQILDIYFHLMAESTGASIQFHVEDGLVKFDVMLPVEEREIISNLIYV